MLVYKQVKGIWYRVERRDSLVIGTASVSVDRYLLDLVAGQVIRPLASYGKSRCTYLVDILLFGQSFLRCIMVGIIVAKCT